MVVCIPEETLKIDSKVEGEQEKSGERVGRGNRNVLLQPQVCDCLGMDSCGEGGRNGRGPVDRESVRGGRSRSEGGAREKVCMSSGELHVGISRSRWNQQAPAAGQTERSSKSGPGEDQRREELSD